MQRILLMSLDENYRNRLSSLLKDEDYAVCAAASIEECVDRYHAKTLDVILVDIDPWGGEGMAVYGGLREDFTNCSIPCIIIASGDLMKDIQFSLSFDDFIIKRGDPGEVPLRIRQLLWRRSRLSARNTLAVKDLTIDLNRYEAAVQGTRLNLTYREYELLKFLVLNRGRVFTREVLLERVWGYENYVGTRTVDIHIQRLRTKLGGKSDSYIETIRNVGYSFISEDKEILR